MDMRQQIIELLESDCVRAIRKMESKLSAGSNTAEAIGSGYLTGIIEGAKLSKLADPDTVIELITEMAEQRNKRIDNRNQQN